MLQTKSGNMQGDDNFTLWHLYAYFEEGWWRVAENHPWLPASFAYVFWKQINYILEPQQQVHIFTNAQANMTDKLYKNVISTIQDTRTTIITKNVQLFIDLHFYTGKLVWDLKQLTASFCIGYNLCSHQLEGQQVLIITKI